MRTLWWGLFVAFAATCAQVSAEEFRDTCDVTVAWQPTRESFFSGNGIEALPSNTDDTAVVSRAAAWMRWHGLTYPEIARILEQRNLTYGPKARTASVIDGRRLVAAFKSVALTRANQLDPRRKNTPEIAIRLLNAANLNEVDIAAFLNERGIEWKAPGAKNDDTEDGAEEAKKPKKPKARWTPRSVSLVLAIPTRPGAIYEPIFANAEAMQPVVVEALELAAGARQQYAERMAKLRLTETTRKDSEFDSLFAMDPIPVEKQPTLFRALNYLRYIAILERERHGPFADQAGPALKTARRYEAKAEGIYDVLQRSNQRMIRAGAKTFLAEYALDDLMSEGQFALRKAIDTYDLSRGFKFSTWATGLIKNNFLRLRKTDRTQSRAGALNNVSLDNLGAGTGEDSERRMERKDDKANSALADLIQSEGVARLLEALEKIDKREARVLKLRYGLEDGTEYTLKQIGEDFPGLTRERIRQIEALALTKLAKAIERLSVR